MAKFPLKVIERPLLVQGMLGKDKSGNAVIIIDNKGNSDEERNITLWHEVVHLLRHVGGHSQDEESVEDAARRLAKACPEAINWVRKQ